MKKHPKEKKVTICWCGCSVIYHLHYVEYTGYACTNCDRCNDFAETVDE